MLGKTFVLVLVVATASGLNFQSHGSAPETFTCEECTRELFKFGTLVIKSGPKLVEYLQIAWCPAQHTGCDQGIQNAYPRMLDNIIIHFFMDGAMNICEMEGVCPVKEVNQDFWMKPSMREYTCEECLQGMDYVERLMKDPLFVDRMVLRLKMTYCKVQDNEANCQKDVDNFFPSMHHTVVNHFLVPADICSHQPACGGPTDAP